MRVALIAVSVFVLINHFTTAQIVATKKSENTFINFLGKSDSLFWVAEDEYINSYDFDLNLKSSNKIQGGLDDDYTNAVFFNSRILIIEKDTKHSKKLFAIKKTIFWNGESNDSLIKIFHIDGWEEHFNLKSEGYKFYFRFSTTRHNLLFVYENDYKHDSDNVIKVRVLNKDDELSPIRLLRIPYDRKLTKISNLVFDDSNGEKVITLLTHYDVTSRNKRRAIRTELLEFDLISPGNRKVEMPVYSNYISSKAKYVNGKWVYCFLKSDSALTRITGLGFVTYDGSAEIMGDVQFGDSLSIKKNFWNYFFNSHDLNYLLGHIDTYTLREIQPISDNRILAIIEKDYSRVSISTSPDGAGGVPNGVFANDILVSLFDVSKRSGLTYPIRKKQFFASKDFISYLLLTQNSKANLVFSDDDPKADFTERHYKQNNYLINDSVVQASVSNFTNDFFTGNRLYRFQTKSFVMLNDRDRKSTRLNSS